MILTLFFIECKIILKPAVNTKYCSSESTTRKKSWFQWLQSQPNVPRRKSGLLFLARNGDERKELERLQARAQQNGEKVRIVEKAELMTLEPHLCLENIDSGLLSPEEYIVDPYLLPLSNLVKHLDSNCIEIPSKLC